MKRSWYGFTYLVDWYFAESSKHTAQTLILISESDGIYWYIDVVRNIKEDLKTYLDYYFFQYNKDAFSTVFEVFNPDESNKDKNYAWFETWIAIGLVGLESELISNIILEKLKDVIDNYSIYIYENEYEKEEFQIVLKDYEFIKSRIHK